MRCREAIQLVEILLGIGIRTIGRCETQDSANGSMLADIFVCYVIIFSANALTAGFVAFCSASLASAISF